MPDVGSADAMTFAPTSKFYQQKMNQAKPYWGLVVPRESRDFKATLADFCVCLQISESHGVHQHTTLSKKASLPVGIVSISHNLELP